MARRGPPARGERRLAAESRHSYFPVARGDLDDLLGIASVKERLGFRELPREDAPGRVPEEGDRFEREGHSFEVLDMDGRRVDKVLVAPTSE